MLRTIRNIFILILIGITASGMPIYASSFNYSALIPTIIPKDEVIIVTTEEKIISNNHVQIKYGFSADSDKNHISILFDEDNPFDMELRSSEDAELVDSISLEDIVALDNYKALDIYDKDPAYIIFDFDQNKLDLPYGSYNLKLYPNAEGKQFDLDKSEFNITFRSEGTYVSALSNSVAGQTPLTLYFPDKDLMYLVPITRFVPYTSSPLTTTLRNLEKGPSSEVGLLNTSSIPFNGKAGKVEDIAYVNLPADLGTYDQGSSTATMAVHSLVNSLTSTDGVHKVQFQFNGRVKKEAFHGMAMDEPYFKPEDTMIYTAYLSDTNRFLLAPVPLNRFGAVTEKYDESTKIPTIFDTLKFKSHGVYNSKIHPIVPNEVQLLDYSIHNGMLTLTFNESFEKAYEYNKQLHQMMIDGIIFTFTSLDNVDSISIKVKLDSEDLNNQEVIHYDFTPPVYINPEI